MKYFLTGNPEKGAIDTFHLIMAPTYDCNLGCKHCYNDSMPNTVSKEQWKGVIGKWADFVKKEGKEGISHFKGGEPFVFEGIDELLGYSADSKLLVFVTSNGTLIDDRQAESLGEVYRRARGKIILSLNGSTPEVDEQLREVGTYQKTVDAAKRLRKNNVPFDINYVTHSGNEEDVERTIRLSKELGAVQFNLLPLVERGSAIKNGIGMPDLAKVLKQVERAVKCGADDMLEWSVADMIEKLGSGEYACDGCTAGFRGFAYITPDGNVYSCPNTVMEEHKLGTIDDSFDDLFESRNARHLMEIHKGSLVCKGELEEYRTQPQSMENLLKSDELIKRKISEATDTSETRKPIAVCFNRNW